jgi:hypothetical protein
MGGHTTSHTRKNNDNSTDGKHTTPRYRPLVVQGVCGGLTKGEGAGADEHLAKVRAAGLLPARVEGWRGAGGTSKVKVTVLQQLSKARHEAAASVDAFLHAQLKREGRTADILILPENWLGASGHVRAFLGERVLLLHCASPIKTYRHRLTWRPTAVCNCSQRWQRPTLST